MTRPVISLFQLFATNLPYMYCLSTMTKKCAIAVSTAVQSRVTARTDNVRRTAKAAVQTQSGRS